MCIRDRSASDSSITYGEGRVTQASTGSRHRRLRASPRRAYPDRSYTTAITILGTQDRPYQTSRRAVELVRRSANASAATTRTSRTGRTCVWSRSAPSPATAVSRRSATIGDDQNVFYRVEGTGDLRGQESTCLYRADSTRIRCGTVVNRNGFGIGVQIGGNGAAPRCARGPGRPVRRRAVRAAAASG